MQSGDFDIPVEYADAGLKDSFPKHFAMETSTSHVPSSTMQPKLPSNFGQSYSMTPTSAPPTTSSASQRPSIPDYAPCIPPGVIYSTAHAVWTAQELQLLQQGLSTFRSDHYDNVTRYIKIAAAIPGKSVRDVAFKIRAISLAQETLLEEEHQAKRMKMDPAAQAAKWNASTGQEQEDEVQINAILYDNVVALDTMRMNLCSGKLEANQELITRFQKNFANASKALKSMSGSLPSLPLTPDTSLIEMDNNQPLFHW